MHGTEGGDGNITDGSLELIQDAGDGTIAGGLFSEFKIISKIFFAQPWSVTATWVTTGAEDSNQFTCKALRTTIDEDDIDRIELTILWFPE